MRKPKRKAPSRIRLFQWVKIIALPHDYLVVYGDELGGVSAFDRHGLVLRTAWGTSDDRSRRLAELMRSPDRFRGWGKL